MLLTELSVHHKDHFIYIIMVICDLKADFCSTQGSCHLRGMQVVGTIVVMMRWEKLWWPSPPHSKRDHQKRQQHERYSSFCVDLPMVAFTLIATVQTITGLILMYLSSACYVIVIHARTNPLICHVLQRPARRSARVRLKQESKIDDPWKLLDPHEPRKTENKPYRKGRVLTSYSVVHIVQISEGI